MLRLTISVDDVDYDALMDRFLPQISEQMRTSGSPLGSLLSGGVSADLAKKFLQNMDREKKERFLADWINGNQVEIANWIEEAGRQQGISLRVTETEAEQTDV